MGVGLWHRGCPSVGSDADEYACEAVARGEDDQVASPDLSGCPLPLSTISGMVRLPDHVDSEMPGSRFTSRPGIALGARHADADYLTEREVEARFPWLLEDDAILGQPEYSLGGHGRGAEAPIAILEWLGNAAATGIIGGIAIAGMKALGHRFTIILERLRDDPDAIIGGTTRGMAALVAVDAVGALHGESGRLDVEAVDQPATMGGDIPHESNHFAVEPWIVLLVNESRTTRYVVIVASDGDIRGTVATPMGEFEGMFSTIRSDIP